MQTDHDVQLNRRVRDVIATVFRLSPEEVGGDLRLGSPPQWDSLGHMQLVLVLEQEFGLMFPVSAMSQMITVDAIIQAIQTHIRSQR